MVSKIISALTVFTIFLSGVAGCTADDQGSNQTQTQVPIDSITTTIPHFTQAPTLVTTQPVKPPVTTPRPGGEIMKLAFSDKPRVTDIPSSLEDIDALAQGNLAFTVDLYSVLSQKDGNLFFSPYSVYQALSMTYAGARGETEKQMASTLHFALPQNLLHPAYNSLDLLLAQRGEAAEGKDDQGFRLNVVNAIWGQDGYYFLPEFLDVLSQSYGAGIRLLDFAKEPELSRIIINDWVSEQTEQRIEDLLAEGSILEATRLVLTNAIYFNAGWQHPFEERLTKDGSFYLLNGSSTAVSMMNQTSYFGYKEGFNYQAVEMPYSGGELSMIIMLPDEGFFGTFEAGLGADALSGILDGIKYQDVALSLPKFGFASEFSLKQTLARLGMPIAFSDAADFSGMNGNLDLCIGDVVHKSFVAVDEAGTEAAAATAVSMIVKAIPDEPVSMIVNRPYIFMIRDMRQGLCCLSGGC